MIPKECDMNRYYRMEKNEGNETVYIPDGNIENIESGVPVSFIANAPLFIKILNESYGEMLLHYQDSSKIDVQRLLTRCVRKYLEEIKEK